MRPLRCPLRMAVQGLFFAGSLLRGPRLLWLQGGLKCPGEAALPPQRPGQPQLAQEAAGAGTLRPTPENKPQLAEGRAVSHCQMRFPGDDGVIEERVRSMAPGRAHVGSRGAVGPLSLAPDQNADAQPWMVGRVPRTERGVNHFPTWPPAALPPPKMPGSPWHLSLDHQGWSGPH